MAIWVLKEGQREGPYEERDVRELMYEGTYTDSDAAIRDGQFDWTTLGQVLERAPAAPEEAGAEEPATSQEATPEPPPIPEMPEAVPRPPERVAVVDFQMPFGSMVVFMVKWVIAAIPALLILGIVAAIFWGVFLALVASLLRH